MTPEREPNIAERRLMFAAPPPKDNRNGLQIGTLLAVDEDGASITVELDGVPRRAVVAVGCLVRPLAKDRVLLVVAGDETFVLNVLERPAPNYAILALPGRGNLSIEGETVAIAARQRMALRADALDLRASTMTVAADKTTWLGRIFTLVVERLRSSARIQEQSADTLTTKAVDRVAVVDRADSLEAGTQSTRIQTVSTMSAQSAVVTVVDDLRLDGKRVSVG